MRHRHPLPEAWLFTDARMGDALWPAIARLPRGSGIVFRHDDAAGADNRLVLARRVAAAARRGGHMLVAGDAKLARRVGAAVHVKAGRGMARPALTAAAHGCADIVRARRAGARLVFLSPVHPTRSHPGAAALGRVRFGLMVQRARVAVAALGGMTGRRFRALQPLGASGWGAIDAWIGGLVPGCDGADLA